MTIVIENLHT